VSRFSLRNGMGFRDLDVIAETIAQERLLGVWRYILDRDDLERRMG